MHDLVHDLARSISEEVCCIMKINDRPSTLERIRHLSIEMNIPASLVSIWMRNIKSSRTFYTRAYDFALSNVFNFRSLHVLKVTLPKLSSSIGHLKSLRYLDLSDGKFETLPKSICKLWNLQVLKLDHCRKLQNLPNNLIRLKALQHLSLNDCWSLQQLPNNLIHLKALQHLYLFGCLTSIFDDCSVIEGLGEDLQHVTALQELSLIDLPNLTSLPDSLGNLISLQELRILRCPKLICLPASIQSLTDLKSLYIHNCPELEKWCKRETCEDWPKISHIQNLTCMFLISCSFLSYCTSFILDFFYQHPKIFSYTQMRLKFNHKPKLSLFKILRYCVMLGLVAEKIIAITYQEYIENHMGERFSERKLWKKGPLSVRTYIMAEHQITRDPFTGNLKRKVFMSSTILEMEFFSSVLVGFLMESLILASIA
ncbi:resistance domain protein, putative [Medicago truncatula]|uniref:Resistance domain protein, putative n=1 Tax=Medicago truncatula TaxID=3880 RepID=G7K452_MEDTR|nr:resistance domain protein, putative [Medicago truncatula]